MTKATNLTVDLFDYLNNNINYAVLRNYEKLPHYNASRDVDIMIVRDEYSRSKAEIVKIITSKGFLITTHYTSSRMDTFVCVCCNDNDIEIVQFDFFFNTSIYGLVLLKAEEILTHREFNGEIYHVSKEFEFLDKYLYLKGFNVKYPQKYESTYSAIKQRGKIDFILQSVCGIKSLTELELISSSKMIAKMLVYNIKKRPIYQLRNFIVDIYYSIANFIYCKGISVGFTGPDGAGKTTVINSICQNLLSVYGVKLFHFRPQVLSNIGDVAHNTGLAKSVDKEFSNPHRAIKTGLLSSFLRLSYYTVDYFIGYYTKVRGFLYRRSIIVFDRYYTDIITDSRRSRMFLNAKFLYCWGRLFIPRLQYNILLTADTDIILARKQELDRKGIEAINAKLDYLATKEGYYLVKNNGTAEEAATEILRIIFDTQHAKNIKKI